MPSALDHESGNRAPIRSTGSSMRMAALPRDTQAPQTLTGLSGKAPRTLRICRASCSRHSRSPVLRSRSGEAQRADAGDAQADPWCSGPRLNAGRANGLIDGRVNAPSTKRLVALQSGIAQFFCSKLVLQHLARRKTLHCKSPQSRSTASHLIHSAHRQEHGLRAMNTRPQKS